MMKVVVLMRLSDGKARDHLLPLLLAPSVQQVILVRHAPVQFQDVKLRQVIHHTQLDEGTGRQHLMVSLKNVWLCFWNGLKLAHAGQGDTILAFNFVPYGVIAWAVARLGGKKAVVSLIGTDFNLRVQTGLLAPLLRAVLRDCDAITIFGEEARKKLIEYGVAGDKIRILPHAIDTSVYQPNTGVEPLADLIYLGYLRYLKRVDRIIRALPAVLARRPETTLWIVGDGPAREELEHLAKTLDVAQAVTFRGWSAEPAAMLRQARIFISLSDYEGLPMAVIEALCTGLPVIVTAVGAIDTVVEDGINGYLLPPVDETVPVADRILKILDQPGHYQKMRDAALAVRDQFTYETASLTWEQVAHALNSAIEEHA